MAGKLRIGEDGAVEIDAQTREHLAGRDFTLLMGPGNLLLAVEEDGAAAPAAAPMLAGDLRHVGFPGVFRVCLRTQE